MFLEELTWTELRDQIRAGKTTIIVPIGGTEQNGPHMALGKHNLRVRYLSEKIARALGNALVAPVIAYVPEGALAPPTGHMRFPGTITVPEDAFDKILEYAARSFKLAGFHDIVFLGDHGSYQKDEKMVANRLNKEWAAQPIRVHGIEEYYRASESEFGRLLTEQGFSRRRSRDPRRSRRYLADARRRPSSGADRSPAARRRGEWRSAPIERRTRPARR